MFEHLKYFRKPMETSWSTKPRFVRMLMAGRKMSQKSINRHTTTTRLLRHWRGIETTMFKNRRKRVDYELDKKPDQVNKLAVEIQFTTTTTPLHVSCAITYRFNFVIIGGDKIWHELVGVSCTKSRDCTNQCGSGFSTWSTWCSAIGQNFPSVAKHQYNVLRNVAICGHRSQRCMTAHRGQTEVSQQFSKTITQHETSSRGNRASRTETNLTS